MNKALFRVYDKQRLRYVVPDRYTTIYMLPNGDLFYEIDGFARVTDALVVEWSLGVVDKNGRPIYENDIIQCAGGETFEVGWQDAGLFPKIGHSYPSHRITQQWVDEHDVVVVGTKYKEYINAK